MSMFLIKPQVVPDLDPGFRPFALLSRALRIKQGARKVTLAVEQADGSVFHFVCYLPGGEDAHSIAFSQYLLMHNVRAALWVHGGYRVHIYGAPTPVVNWLKYHYYAYDVRGLFDADVMGEQVYFRKFEIIEHQSRSSFPEPRRNDLSVKLGGKGCYIGFDLGASNRRVVAVQDGQVVFEEDVDWLPVTETDPQFHYDGIIASLRAGAAKLPRVDGIGGSSAGVIVGNSTRIASLYRGVPRDKFRQFIVPQFQRMQAEFGGVPFVVVNDGEVAALAAAIEENATNVVGIALGSSLAGGHLTKEGTLTTKTNELAFVPIDLNPNAPIDPWSQYRGVGGLYLSQQMTPRLAAAAGITLDPKAGLPEQLKFVKELLGANGEDAAKAERVLRNVGIHLGYALATFDEFYTMDMAYLMGRVVEGRAGELVVEEAKRVLTTEFPDIADRCKIVRPTGNSVSMGQAVAAAYLAAAGK